MLTNIQEEIEEIGVDEVKAMVTMIIVDIAEMENIDTSILIHEIEQAIENAKYFERL